MDPQNNSKPKNSLFLLIVLAAIVFFLFLVYWIYRGYKQNSMQVNRPANQEKTLVPTSVPNEGMINVRLTQGQGSLIVNQPINIDLVASSDARSIVGYDLLFKYDTSSIDIVKTQSLLPDFSLYPSKKPDHYTVTGVKSLSSKIPTILNETLILRITILPKIAGSLTFNLIPILGEEKTQMVDDKTNILSPNVNELTLEIR